MAVSEDHLTEIAAWAQELTGEERARAAAAVTEKTTPKGSYVCHVGDRLESWTGIVSGLVKMSAVSSLGKPVTFTGVAAGGWFGEGTLIKDEARQYDIIALRDTRVAYLSGQTFRHLFATSAGFNRFLVRQLNERLGQFIGMVAYDRMLESQARIARNIAWLFNPVLFPGVGDEMEISQEEIGLLSGVSRQAANRCLKQLEAENLVELQANGLRVRDRAALLDFGG